MFLLMWKTTDKRSNNCTLMPLVFENVNHLLFSLSVIVFIKVFCHYYIFCGQLYFKAIWASVQAFICLSMLTFTRLLSMRCVNTYFSFLILDRYQKPIKTFEYMKRQWIIVQLSCTKYLQLNVAGALAVEVFQLVEIKSSLYWWCFVRTANDELKSLIPSLTLSRTRELKLFLTLWMCLPTNCCPEHLLLFSR